MIPEQKTDEKRYVLGENGKRLKTFGKYPVPKDWNPELLPDNAIREYLNAPFGVDKDSTQYDYIMEHVFGYHDFKHDGLYFFRRKQTEDLPLKSITDMIEESQMPISKTAQNGGYFLAARFIPKEYLDRLAGKGDIFDNIFNRKPGSGFTEEDAQTPHPDTVERGGPGSGNVVS